MTYQQLSRRLAKVYDEGEAKAIVRMVYEVHYGLSMSDILMGRDENVPASELEDITQRLERKEPVQYVLGEAEFGGRMFHIAPGVLIPRPETAELCQWTIAPLTTYHSPLTILDIGTGSGCIAITLAAEMPEAKVAAWDISVEALNIARKNAQRHHVEVPFEQVDILANSQQLTANSYDIIVSNPPYICRREAKAMEQNVLDYEPHIALFVPDDDPLLFYRAIADYGLTALKKDGWLYFEINPLYANDLASLLKEKGYHDIEIKNDQFGKQRFLKGKK